MLATRIGWRVERAAESVAVMRAGKMCTSWVDSMACLMTVGWAEKMGATRVE